MGPNFIHVSFLTTYSNATCIPLSASRFAPFFESHAIHGSESSVDEASNVVAVVVVVVVVVVVDVVVRSWRFPT